MKLYSILYGILLLTRVSVAEDENDKALMELALPDAPAPQAAPSTPIPSKRTPELKARMDTDFSVGSNVQQGFSVPSLRLAAFGSASDHINYRVSLGQTREFSTALLPQIIPVEAIINMHTLPDENGLELASFRVGMFSPSINPWWTPDLGDIRLPDYNETHKTVFLTKEMGAEVTIRPIKYAEVSIGAFNGAGIFGLNTNGAKAFNAFVRGVVPIGDVNIIFGSGNYVLNQASPGSVNYKMAFFSDEFIQVNIKPIRLELMADIYFGRFEDSVVSVSPAGTGLAAILGITDSISLFGRIEDARSVPQQPGPLRHYEVGPMVQLAEGVYGFAYFQYLQVGNSIQKLGHVRFRLTM